MFEPAKTESRALLGDTPTGRSEFYRRACGLPCTVDSCTGRIVLTVGSVGGVTMPAYLGEAVLDRMDAVDVTVGPIISHPRSRRWTILARSDVADYREVFCHLYRLDATLTPLGAQIALPSSFAPESALRTWIQAPSGTDLPLATEVIELLLRSSRDARR